jgi:predicted O-methyltransferase YrrM
MRQQIQRTLDGLERQRLSQPDQPRPGERFSQHPGPNDLKDKMLAVGPDTAKLLNTLIRATRARNVLEIGGSMGYSTIWMAEAVEVNGGRLTTLEYVPEKAALLRQRISEAGLGATVEVYEGDALQILPQLNGPWDLVLVDAWKDDYPAYFDLVFPSLNVGGLMVADNITFPTPLGEGIETYLEKARSQPNAQSQLIPLASGLELTIRLG